MALSVPKAELTGVFLESLAYGVYLMVFNQCVSVLKRRSSRPSDYLVGTAVSLFILITAHLVIDIVRNMEAFTSNEGVTNYPSTYYSTWDTWKNILKSGLYVAVTLVSDAFILYRSFIVWGRNYIITAFPFLLFVADIAIGIFWVYTLSLVLPHENVFVDALFVRVTTFYSITLAMNVICTCLIAAKILTIQRAIAPYSIGAGKDQISRLVPIVVESGAAYSAFLVVMISTYTSGSPAMFIFLNSMSPIIGIVFSSVIVRVGLGLSHGDSHPTTGLTSSTRWAARGGNRHTISDQQIYTPSFPGGGAQVSLQQTIHTHIDGFSDEVGSNKSGFPDYKSSSGYAV